MLLWSLSLSMTFCLNLPQHNVLLFILNTMAGHLRAATLNYHKVASTSLFRLEAHAGFFRLSMKRKFDVYLLCVI